MIKLNTIGFYGTEINPVLENVYNSSEKMIEYFEGAILPSFPIKSGDELVLSFQDNNDVFLSLDCYGDKRWGFELEYTRFNKYSKINTSRIYIFSADISRWLVDFASIDVHFTNLKLKSIQYGGSIDDVGMDDGDIDKELTEYAEAGE